MKHLHGQRRRFLCARVGLWQQWHVHETTNRKSHEQQTELKIIVRNYHAELDQRGQNVDV